MATTSSTSSASQTSFDYTALNKTTTASQSDMEVQQDRFMKLLVAQLQNQDPMNPMDSAETTSQMAQINMVTQLSKLNDSMTSLAGSYSAQQAVQAASLIGKSVLGSGSAVSYQGAAVDFQVGMTAGLKGGVVQVLNSSGSVVKEIEFGAQSTAGDKAITWDGKLADGSTATTGNYTVKAYGVQSDGSGVALGTKTWQKVGSVALSSGATQVVLADGTALALSSVTQIR